MAANNLNRHKAALRDAAAAMRGAAAATWDTTDYTGKYHAKQIATPFPVPGTQLRRERERARDAEERRQAPARIAAAQAARTRKALAEYERVAGELEDIRAAYGWQANAAMSGQLCTEIDVQTAKFAARQEPDPHALLDAEQGAAGRARLDGDRLRLSRAVRGRDYRDLHLLFLGDESSSGEVDCDFAIDRYNTPLIWAVRRGDVRMCRILLNEGQCDPNYPNTAGVPPLFYVFEEWRDQILHKVPGRDSLRAMLDRAKDLVTELGARGANVNALGLGGETPVHVAAGLGHARHLFLMCKFGFDPSLRNNAGQTALDVARAQDKLECVVVLTEWPKIRRTVELELFRDGWKPFLAHPDPRFSMHKTTTTDDILETLHLREQTRRNELIERKLQFGTSVKFVLDDDAVLARGPGGDMDAASMQTETSAAAMRAALRTSERRQTAKELRDEQQRIARAQALQYKKGGMSRKARKALKSQRAAEAKVRRQTLTPIQRRRMRLVRGILTGGKSSTPGGDKKRLTLAQELRKNSRTRTHVGGAAGAGESDDDDEEDGGVDVQSVRAERGKPEPLRPAIKSAIFRPRRISPSRSARGSRASLMPRGLTRQEMRRSLKKSSVLLPSEVLAMEERKTPAQILAEKLEGMLHKEEAAGGKGKKGADALATAVAAAVIPEHLLPPAYQAAEEVAERDPEGSAGAAEGDGAGVMGDGGDGGVAASAGGQEGQEGEEVDVRSTRSRYTGFAPGFKPMTEPWRQSTFELQLPRIVLYDSMQL